MRVAVDVMGGDHAPDAILKGCIGAIPDLGPEDELILVGRQEIIREVLDDRGVKDPRIIVEHAEQVIEMGDSAAMAVRAKRDSSIVKIAHLGSEKSGRRADVVLSAGNTGACVSAAIMHMRRLPQVHRPGIAVTFPAFHGPVILIDAGANPEPRASHLWQYAIMADVVARQALKKQSPRIAQMNIGAEEAKGTGVIKETRDLLKRTPGINYVGYIEGRDLFEGVCDVVVTDGFVGNTLLKMAEGMAKSLFSAIASELLEADPTFITQLEPVIKRIYAKNDYHEYGGAPLLGVNGSFFIAHGSSEARTITAAIRNCRAYVNAGVNRAIVARLGEITGLMGSVIEAEHEPA